MYKPESDLEYNTHKLLWDFDMRTDHLISARRPDPILINKKKKKRLCKIVDFAVPADHRTKLKECEKKDKFLDLARELKKLWYMKLTITPIVFGAFGTLRIIKGTGGLESWRTRGDLPNNMTIMNGQNTKSPGDLRRHGVTQTPEKDYQLTLMGKAPKE